MQNLPDTIDKTKELIINLSLENDPKTISDQTKVPLGEVFAILSDPNVMEIRERRLKQANLDLQLKRISESGDILNKVIEGVRAISESDPFGWKMTHFKLFEMLLKEIPEQIKSIQQFNNFQINEKSLADANTEQSLEDKMSQLPAKLKIQFWAEVEALAENYIRMYEAKKVQNASVIDAGWEPKSE